jgi:hypothetical protein
MDTLSDWRGHGYQNYNETNQLLQNSNDKLKQIWNAQQCTEGLLGTYMETSTL